MVELYPGELDVNRIFARWLRWGERKNYGAYVSFVGIVRAEDGIEALSFDVYEPLLKKWFKKWEERAKKEECIIKMAHSKGNVPIHTSSYIAAVFSPRRRKALELIDQFVEDFKANAPIWKYDLKNGERIYAKDRSQPIEGSGILLLWGGEVFPLNKVQICHRYAYKEREFYRFYPQILKTFFQSFSTTPKPPLH